MREIKFRAQRRSENREWVYGGLKTFSDGSVTIHDERVGAKDFTGLEYPCDWETVGQYTGLKDKNGKEIYEGDILSVWKKYRTVIVWEDLTAKFRSKHMNPYSGQCSMGFVAKNGKIIGNIYENRELLEK